VKGVEGVQSGYTTDFHTMMGESLIRAAEIRIDRPTAVRAKEAVDNYYRAGLLLVPFFYGALVEYEGQEQAFRTVFPKMVSAINVDVEAARFSSTFMSIPVAQRSTSSAEVPVEQPAPVANPMRDLLKEGEAALNANNSEKAKAAFEKVLSDYERSNGAALYGLGLLASKEGDSGQARDYFERATRSEGLDPAMKVWAYIYLARILDLDCERERALANYRQAERMGDNTRNAQAAAKEGIRKPFGDACSDLRP